jgi:hypothetical protein
MVYAVCAVVFALVTIAFLVARRRDPRVATLKSLPKYGTPEASSLQQAIAAHGPTRLLSPADSSFNLVEIEPARSSEYFREQITAGGRSPSSPAARRRRARIKPVKPKPATAPKARPGFAPPRTVLVVPGHEVGSSGASPLT